MIFHSPTLQINFVALELTRVKEKISISRSKLNEFKDIMKI
ncbi:hypothetical protein [Tissierella sp.]